MRTKKTLGEIKSDFHLVWGDTYNYDLITEDNYKNFATKVPIVCKEHGVFFVTPSNHIIRKVGCQVCSREKISKKYRHTTEQFIKKAEKKHGGKYDYSRVVYVNNYTKVIIGCPIHGWIEQTPHEHLNSNGCGLCGNVLKGSSKVLTTKQFVEKAKIVHGDLYDYGKVVYDRANKKVIITCKTHGDFFQTPNNHIHGKGCPKCKKSFGENKIGDYLTKKDIKYIPQYSIHNENIFCKNKVIKVDFYLETYNTIIEYNGQQHYKEEPYFCSRNLEEQQIRDMSLRQYCKEHKIKLIEIPYWEFNNIENIINKELRL